MAFDKAILDILACPVCKNDLVMDHDETGLVCYVCALEYPIKDGIPVLIPEEALEI